MHKSALTKRTGGDSDMLVGCWVAVEWLLGAVGFIGGLLEGRRRAVGPVRREILQAVAIQGPDRFLLPPHMRKIDFSNPHFRLLRQYGGVHPLIWPYMGHTLL